eukprot:CAMPEP_0119300736 /NCGR_PEP_ID=MMETSP1333-20130426/2650_1 /TAXON_ID=418940 /ORGANISM="Scyphosphaera apsteinii, Strain RCC1455" /LENGTH=153 /DNA_ID=CAMNT_0007302623 /DNA_START=11 /DNA_END=472 /DNA_ORIENTATION=-
MLFLLASLRIGHVSSEVLTIESDTDFEAVVLQDPACWVVLFTSATRPEKVEPAVAAFHELEQRVGEDLRFGIADVDKVKAVSSEFNVRKRMVPRFLAFKSRARQADVLALGGSEMGAATLHDLLKDVFAENERATHVCQKKILAIGAGGPDEL